MKKLMLLLAFLFAVSANATTITFNEGLAPIGTQLQGTSFYDSFGVSFESSLLFGPDSRLPDDGFGITNTPLTTGAINFFDAVNQIDLTWATSGTGVSFIAEAFNALGNLIDIFTFNGAGVSGSQSGVASLSGAGIVRLEYHDSGSTVAIDTLTFTSTSVPEPAGLALLGMGMLLMGLNGRKKNA